MSVRLSHTAKEKYLASPRAYYYHYLLNLRAEVLGSPLFFGSLIEVGLDVLLKGGKLADALTAYKKAFRMYEHNGVTIDLSSSPYVKYSKSDYDPDVFTDDELKALSGKPEKFKAYQSLVRKGEMLIEAYSQDILPKIKKVIDTQVYFAVPNGAGDEIIGYADLICEWEDGRILVPDHKTSAQAYPKDAVLTEEKGKQTALYFEVLREKYSIDATGFFVLEKKIRKKTPRARTQIIIDTPSEELIQKTFDEYDNVLYNIKQASFPCCSPKCDVFGQSCPYKAYCATGGENLTGLVKIDKTSKKT